MRNNVPKLVSMTSSEGFIAD